MAASSLTPLIFSLSFEELIQACIEKEAFLRRDIKYLSPRGITILRLDAFAAERDSFIAISPNRMDKNISTQGFKARNIQASSLMKSIKEVIGIAKNTFGIKSAQYKGFNIKGLSRLSAEMLCTQSVNIVTKGKQNLAAMSLRGLKNCMLTKITTKSNALLPLIAATPTLQSNSEENTVIRRTAANALYFELNQMCQTATIFFTDRNKLKANDYVIYHRDKILIRKGTLKQNEIITRKATHLTSTTQFKLKVPTGKSLKFYFGMTETSIPELNSVTVICNTKTFVTTTAEKLGYDKEKGLIHFIIRNNNLETATFIVKIGGK